jgi:hypothetical protein
LKKQRCKLQMFPMHFVGVALLTIDRF